MTDLKVEVIVLPVSDVDRAKEFYKHIGFHEDLDYVGVECFRVVHLTPPASAVSIIIGDGVTDAEPGSARGIHLVVDDIIDAREDLVSAGGRPSEIFHDAGGVFHHSGTGNRVLGPHPGRKSYGSFFSFEDPDGNEFVVQEVTKRHPGRVNRIVYSTVAELERALRAAAVAHGHHEDEIGHEDAEWPTWYAQHMAAESGLHL